MANLEVHPDGKVSRRLPLESHLQILRAMWERDPIEVAARVQVPVLVIVAEMGPPRHQQQVDNFMSALSRGQLHRMAGHHDLHAQHPDRVVGVIKAALDDGFWR
jgi:hypothetical protein